MPGKGLDGQQQAEIQRFRRQRRDRHLEYRQRQSAGVLVARDERVPRLDLGPQRHRGVAEQHAAERVGRLELAVGEPGQPCQRCGRPLLAAYLLVEQGAFKDSRDRRRTLARDPAGQERERGKLSLGWTVLYLPVAELPTAAETDSASAYATDR